MLPEGSRVIIPFRQLHIDEDAYGSDADNFNPERFVRSKTLVHSASYRPFGGGVSYCPGRFLAKQEVVLFIALVVARFDVKVAGNGHFPQMNDMKPTTGLMSPRDGEDVLLELRPKV